MLPQGATMADGEKRDTNLPAVLVHGAFDVDTHSTRTFNKRAIWTSYYVRTLNVDTHSTHTFNKRAIWTSYYVRTLNVDTHSTHTFNKRAIWTSHYVRILNVDAHAFVQDSELRLMVEILNVDTHAFVQDREFRLMVEQAGHLDITICQNYNHSMMEYCLYMCRAAKYEGRPESKERLRITGGAPHLLPQCELSSGTFKMAALIENPAKCELRSVIRFLNAQNVRPIEIYRQIKAVYGDKAPVNGMASLEFTNKKQERKTKFEHQEIDGNSFLGPKRPNPCGVHAERRNNQLRGLHRDLASASPRYSEQTTRNAVVESGADPRQCSASLHVFRRKNFLGDEDLKEGVKTWLHSLAAEQYNVGIEKLVPRYNKCLDSSGDFVEK
ncbi:hypothetical protein J6590_023113 [Homalodisca vitripennis]|nr:hypothetical protein J6590_023113 [Homalodisca vitripennis]